MQEQGKKYRALYAVQTETVSSILELQLRRAYNERSQSEHTMNL